MFHQCFLYLANSLKICGIQHSPSWLSLKLVLVLILLALVLILLLNTSEIQANSKYKNTSETIKSLPQQALVL